MRQHGVEGLAGLVGLVLLDLISEAEAARRAEAADWLWDDDQILGGTQALTAMRTRGSSLRTARVFASLLLTTVERVRPQAWRPVANVFVQVATEAATVEPDGALFARASDVATRLARDAKPPELFSLGHLWLEPFATDPISGSYPARERARRVRLERRSSDWAEEIRMPEPVPALGQAQMFFTGMAAGTTGIERGYALVHQAYAAYSLAEAGGDVNPDEYLALCREAWPLLGNEPLGTARACWLLAQHDALGQVAAHPLALPRVEQLVAGYGPRLTAVVAAIGLRLFSQHDRAFARRLSEDVLAALPAEALESHRAWFAQFPAHLLPDDPTDCATAAATGSLPALALRAQAAGWTGPQLADATVHALIHDTIGGWADSAEAGQDRDGLLDQVHGHRMDQVARALISAGDYATGTGKAIRAAVLHMENKHPEAAEACLQLAAAAVAESRNAACVAVTELTKYADLLAMQLGQPGANALDEIYRMSFTHLNTPGERPFPLTALMQLAKGRAFARSQTTPGPLIAHAAEEGSLAAALAAEAALPDTNWWSAEDPLDAGTALFDNDAFLGAYLRDAEVQAGRTTLEELANRRRVCQLLDTIRLTGHVGPTPVRGDDELRGQLPPDTVLLSLYEGAVATPPQPGIVFMFHTAEKTWSVTLVYRGKDPQLEVSVSLPDSGFTRRIRYAPGAWHTAHLRRMLLEDPLYRAVSREAEGELAGEAIHFEALLDQLASLRDAGKRRLVIWPHGVYYFFPFHLLPAGDGRLLADDWTVTLVPSLESILGVPRTDARESILAMASPDGGVPHGMAAEPAVDQHARTVAAAFGTEPLLDAAATKNRFLAQAGHFRFVHVAAHGAQYSPAPLFDRLYLTDSPIYAHDVLRQDLRGVELVTLSACESSLLRFDLSDNLHGIAAAFLRAGAAAVVGALWPVRAAVAGTFFDRLYSRLAEGQGKLTAFRDAQLATRLEHPEYRDWGAFSMLGDCWER